MEPCTLVYTLNSDDISFNDFDLIIRSLHSYMVESITPNPDMKNMHVKLGYQASVANAQNKLGDLQEFVSVSKLSAYVKESELSHLDELRRRFNIPSSSSANETNSAPKRAGFGKQRRVNYAPRPAPYKKAKQAAVSEREDYDEYPSHDPI